MRRGSETTTSDRGSCSNRAQGTRVVLPAPGGASSTRDGASDSERTRSGSTTSMGSGESVRMRRGRVLLKPFGENDARGAVRHGPDPARHGYGVALYPVSPGSGRSGPAGGAPSRLLAPPVLARDHRCGARGAARSEERRVGREGWG